MPCVPSAKFHVLALLLVAPFLAGCPKARQQDKALLKDEPSSKREETLESARAALGRKPDLAACRGAIQQLNVYLGQQSGLKPALGSRECELLTSENGLGLDADELAEVASPTLTLLDAHHMEMCFLLRDAALSLELSGLPPPKQAAAAFDWVVRQVRLGRQAEDIVPPLFALRRGWGTDQERSLIFLSLLQQLGIDGCLIGFPGDQGVNDRRWLAGALDGKDICLFDSRLGLPLPGPGGNTVATLAQVRANPGLLQALTVDPQLPYDITFEQAQRAEIFLCVPLSALAPRMENLEGLLVSSNKVSLGIAIGALEDKFREAARESGLVVRFWNKSAELPPSPTTALRRFLPPTDGGTDTMHPYTLPEENLKVFFYRKQIHEYERVPWQVLPPQVRQFSSNVPLGQTPRNIFMKVYLTWDLESLLEILRGRTPSSNWGRTTFTNDARDLLLRGQLQEAAALMDKTRELFKKIENEKSEEKEIADWSIKAEPLQANWVRAKEAKDPQALEDAQSRLDEIWSKGFQPLTVLMLKELSRPLNAELTYTLALCNHERAERLEIRWQRAGGSRDSEEGQAAVEAWQAAADRWWTYLKNYGSAPAAAAARLHYARARQRLKQNDAASALLEDLSGPLDPLEKTARLHLARQLKRP